MGTQRFQMMHLEEFGLSSIQLSPKSSNVISRDGPVVQQKYKVGAICFLTIRLYKVPRLHMLYFVGHLHASASNCSYLPPFGLLSFLKYLLIENMNRVVSVGIELYGEFHSSIKPFPSLEILIFREMLEWKEWSFSWIDVWGFPKIQELHIKRCPKLTGSLPKYLPHSIKTLRISKCPHLLIPKLPNEGYRWLTYCSTLEIDEDSGTQVQFDSDDDEVSYEFDSDAENSSDNENSSEEPSLGSRPGTTYYFPGIELPSQLYSLNIERLFHLTSLPEGLIEVNSSIRDLTIVDCPKLKSFHQGYLPVGLKSIYISDCGKLEFILPTITMHQVGFLQDIDIISSCESLTSFPLDLFPRLRNLFIDDCANLGGFSVTKDHMSLLKLHIRRCPKLVCFPKGGLQSPKLRSFMVSKCKNLKALPDQLRRCTSLWSLHINECPALKSIPEGGFPQRLRILSISYCPMLRPCVDWGMIKLKNLGSFQITGCEELTSFPEKNLLPSSLHSLTISELVNLKSLDYRGFQQLTSLTSLTICSCDKLQSFSRGVISSHFRCYIHVAKCALLKSHDWSLF